MYKINEDIADFLLYVRKNPQVPGLIKDEFKPFVQRNTHTIGFVTPIMVQESDSKYLVELALPDVNEPEELERVASNPLNRSWWLYKKAELKPITEPFPVERSKIDKWYTGAEEMDLADCSYKIATEEERQGAILINSIDELFERIPELKDCIDPEKEALYINGNDFHNHH